MAQAPRQQPGGAPFRPGIDIPEGDEAALRNQMDARSVRQTVYSADGAIAVTHSHMAIVTKGSAAAMTLAAPANDGIELIIMAGSAFAHVVTATDLIEDGVTGGAKDTYTTAAFIGSGATLVSYGGKWLLVSKNLGTTAAV
jgi:hypothetical protein